jgi:hypothetical protein
MGEDDQAPHRQYRQHRPPEIAPTRRFFPRDRSKRSTRVNRHQAAQMRPVTRITAASSVSSAPSAVDRPDDTLFRGARDNAQTLNARPADQL